MVPSRTRCIPVHDSYLQSCKLNLATSKCGEVIWCDCGYGWKSAVDNEEGAGGVISSTTLWFWG